jgi:hypothetical protein
MIGKVVIITLKQQAFAVSLGITNYKKGTCNDAN